MSYRSNELAGLQTYENEKKRKEKENGDQYKGMRTIASLKGDYSFV